jgi:type VI secretion system protein ImpE
MIAAEQSLRQGNLEEALAGLQDEVRRRPADARLRIFLFQLLAVLGEWQRALNQLNVLADLDAGALMMVHAYREAIRCEMLREQVFAGQHTPLVFGEPERWVALLLEALRLTAAGEHDRAQALREEALGDAPASEGSVNGEAFAWIADADVRLGPIFEVFLSGAYYWVPMHRIAEVRLGNPEDLRDFVWLPGEFRWSNGGDAVGLIPARYPGSARNEDARVRLGRVTRWEEPAPALFIGQGQRMLATDVGEYPLLEVRSISLAAAAVAGEPADVDG